jgi:ribosomal protein S26
MHDCRDSIKSLATEKITPKKKMCIFCAFIFVDVVYFFRSSEEKKLEGPITKRLPWRERKNAGGSKTSCMRTSETITE